MAVSPGVFPKKSRVVAGCGVSRSHQSVIAIVGGQPPQGDFREPNDEDRREGCHRTETPHLGCLRRKAALRAAVHMGFFSSLAFSRPRAFLCISDLEAQRATIPLYKSMRARPTRLFFCSKNQHALGGDRLRAIWILSRLYCDMPRNDLM